MFDPTQYFVENNLFDWANLNAHAETNYVWVSTSERFPGLALLKYKDECQYEKLWSPFARFSRGLVVDVTNRSVLAHGFNKFHNLNEMPETAYDVLKGQKDFEISEKLDGSCLLSFLNPNDNQFYLTTTGSFDSDHGKVGTEMFRNLPNYEQVCSYTRTGTMIFELIDRRFRIVIDYNKKGYKEGLYLIGYRNQEGRLYTYAEVAALAAQLGLPGPKAYQFDSLDVLLAKTESLTVLDEGFVLRYPDGLMVKIKGLAYLKAHRFISQLSDKHILEAVAEGEEVAEELSKLAPEEYRVDVVQKIAYFKSRKLDLLDQCYAYFAEAPKDQDRKTFALWVNQNVKQSLKGCLFQMLDYKPLKDKDLYKIIEQTEKPSVKTRI